MRKFPAVEISNRIVKFEKNFMEIKIRLSFTLEKKIL